MEPLALPREDVVVLLASAIRDDASLREHLGELPDRSQRGAEFVRDGRHKLGLLARDGQVIGEFATERRSVIDYDQMSPFFRNAVIATEDADFERHFGLSATRILVTLINDVLKGEMAGASTITQQLARNLFPIGFEKTVERKVREAILAIQLERRYTKREIFAFYANQIIFGHGAYGVESASRMYFDKPAKDLNLEESAVLAAIIQAPARLSPFVDPQRTLVRRNYVLTRMAEEGYITADDARAAMARPIIGTHVPGCREEVEDGVNGLLR